MSKLNWGIVGTGQIADTFAKALRESATGRLLAVGSRNQDTAEAFAREHNVTRIYAGYDNLLADPQVQVVYIATPHPMHVEWAIKAAEAGKHILMEKPIGMNQAQAQLAIDAAAHADVFLMEAFMYRCHPQTHRLLEMIQNDAIGQIRLIRATFSYEAPFEPQDLAYRKDLGGGGILDVGCYPISMSRLIAGAAIGEPFAQPLEVKACGHLGPTGVDEYAVAVLRFAGGIVAEAVTGVNLNIEHDQWLEVVGSKGRLHVSEPWLAPRSDGSKPSLTLITADKTSEISVEAPLDLYTYEADEVARCIDHRQSPAMSWADSLGNMQVLDQWRAEIGLIYDADWSDR